MGLLTEDRTLYRPGAFGGARIEGVADCAEAMRRLLYTDLACDLVVPLTHQALAPPRHPPPPRPAP